MLLAKGWSVMCRLFRANRFGSVIVGVLLVGFHVRADISISGTVEDMSGNAVAGAEVRVLGLDLATTSADDGSFSLTGQATAGGYPDWARRARAIPFEIRAGRVTVFGRGRAEKSIAAYDLTGRLMMRVSGDKPVLSVEIPEYSGNTVFKVTSGADNRIMYCTLINGRIAGVPMPHRTVTQSSAPSSMAKTAASNPLVAQCPTLYVAAYKDGYLQGGQAVIDLPASGVTLKLHPEDYFSDKRPFLNPALPLRDRVIDLVGRMTKEQKVHLFGGGNARGLEIPDLRITRYQWPNESLHGVARVGKATSFPQAIGLGATWNTELMFRLASVIGDEARSKHPEYENLNYRRGLNYFAPVINIGRDPRWGRCQETYGEDPWLTTRLGVEYIKGMQGDDARYLKTCATPKHFAVYNKPGDDNMNVSDRDIWSTYMPAFRAAIIEAKAYSIMCSYSNINGTKSCRDTWLLNDLLRDQWGFEGFVMADALQSNTAVYGCDASVHNDYLMSDPDEVVDTAAARVLSMRFKLGMFDPPEMNPYYYVPDEQSGFVERAEHTALALQAARESVVLLKNENNRLPLSKDLSTIAVVGPNAESEDVMLASYFGKPDTIVSVLEGIREAVSAGTDVLYAQGCEKIGIDQSGFADAVAKAEQADVVIAVMGIHSESVEDHLEGEGYDKATIDLDQIGYKEQAPNSQVDFLKALHATGTPVVLVHISGSCNAFPWADENLDAIIQAFYGGQAGGRAVADVIFGEYNPSGKLPVTWYTSNSQLPDVEAIDMVENEWTYRYFSGEPAYPFGYGLSYTTFAYSNLVVNPAAPTTDDNVTVTVEVENSGDKAGGEVVQLYIRDEEASVPVPIHELEGFCKVFLSPSEKRTVTFTVTPEQLTVITDDVKRVIEPGEFSVWVGGCRPGTKTTSNVLSGSFTMGGSPRGFDL